MKKLATGVLAVMIVFSLAYIGGVKAEGPAKETIAALDYEYTDLATDTDTEVVSGAVVSGASVELDLKESKYGNKTDGYKFTTGTGTLFASITGDKTKALEWSSDDFDNPSPEYKMDGEKKVTPIMAATKKNMWTEGTVPYFEVQVSTKGHKDVEFSAYVGASKKGPRDYRLTYAVGDSTTYTALTDANAKISLAKNKEMTKISGVLPAAADNQELVKVRIELASLESVSSTAETPVYLYANPSSGEAAINHIEVKGTNLKTLTTVKPAESAKPDVSASSKPSPTKPGGILRPTKRPGTEKTPTPAVKKIKLNKKKLTLKKGKKYQLKITVKPNNKATVKLAKSKLKWKSSNKKVVTVSKKGKLKAKKKGKATITVKYSNKIKATCKVTVKKK